MVHRRRRRDRAARRGPHEARYVPEASVQVASDAMQILGVLAIPRARA
ncbi:MAG: hypothetical protein ACLTDR_00160 [Adlercreutzia equolifaciens]